MEIKLFGFWTTLLILESYHQNAAGLLSPYGCFPATDPKNLTVSAGNYDPSTAGSSSCFETCGAMDVYSYAAVTSNVNNGNTYCFCAKAVQDGASSLGPANCTVACADGQATCGTDDVFNTYAIPDITSVTVTSSNVANVMSVYDSGTTFTATAVSNGLGGLAYMWDFGTGAGRVKTAAGTSVTKSYAMPGEYELRGYATDDAYLVNAVSSSLTVSVQSPAVAITWLCPTTAATFEEVCCNATIGGGTCLTAVVEFDNANQETLNVADSIWFDAGWPIPEVTDVSFTAGGSQLYILDSTEFSHDGNILFFEYFGSTPGDILLVVLSPVCSGQTYCYDTNTCSSTCDPPTCGPSQAFSPVHRACLSSSTPTAPSAADRYTSKPGDLIVTSVTTVTIAANVAVSQRHDVSHSPIAVKRGDMIGWMATISTPGSVATRPATGQEKGVFETTPGAALSEGSTVTSGAIPSVRAADVHFIRAVASKPSLLVACHTYLTPGVYPVQVNLSNALLSNYTLESVNVDIVEGINASILAHPEYNTTGETVVFTLLPHTGSNITYEWHFGDGASVVTSVPMASHAYTSKGLYTVNVTAANSVSMKENTSSILIQDAVTGLSLTTNYTGSTTVQHPFWLNMTSGSDYTCTWDFNDGQTEQTNETDIPLTGGQWTHVFALERCYDVTVACVNDVSRADTTARACTTAAIENLHLVKTGALVGRPISLDFAIDAGTNATFIVLFNGVQKPYTYDEVTKVGRVSLPSESSTGVFPVEIRAVNMVSDELLQANFTIEEEITGASCSEGYHNGKVNDSLTFSCTIQGGTSIRILWNYTDGSQDDEHVTPTLERWTAGNSQARTHKFETPGVFNVCTTVSNNFNEFPFCMLVKIFNKIEGVSMHAMSPSGFSLGPESPKASFYFTCTAPHSPVEAWVVTDWGDGSPVDNSSFSLADWFTHSFPTKGTYTVTTTVCNLVDCASFSQTFEVMDIILNLQVFGDPEVAVGSPLRLCLTLDAGDSVTLSCDFDHPNGALQTRPRNATTPYEEDCFSHTYSSVGPRTVQCKASNAVMNVTKDHVVDVEQAVVAECYQVTATPAYVTHPAAGTFSLTLSPTGAAGCVAPTAASMAVSWEDEACEALTTGQTTLTTPNSWTNTYSSPGEYSCSVCIQNKVSSVELSPSAKCGIFEGLSGMTVTPLYQPLLPLNSPQREGYTSSKTHFPIDRPVQFQIDITGTVSTYSVAGIDANASTITICEFGKDDPIQINFTTAGDHNVTITANNPLGSVNETLTVTIAEVPVGLTMTTPTSVTAPGQNVAVAVTTQTVGTSPCYDVDFGDGSERHLYGDAAGCAALGWAGVYQGSWTGVITLTHEYTESRLYTMTVCAENYVTTFPLCDSVSFPVSSLGCDVPNITLSDQTKFFYQAVEKEKCKTFSLTAKIVLAECENSLDNKKLWTVEKLNSTTGDVESTVTLPNMKDAKLILHGNTLETGTYRFTLNVTLSAGSGTGSFSSTLRTYVKVVHCPLVASIVGGGVSYKEVGYNRTVTFTPLVHSYDPDVDSTDPQVRSQGMMCSMRCRRCLTTSRGLEPWSANTVPVTPYTQAELETQNITDQGGCFRQGAGFVALTSACELTFNSANMKVNETYQFELTVTKGGRTSTALLKVGVLDGDPPCITLRCQQSRCEEMADGLLLRNPSYSLPLRASLECGGSAAGLLYFWEVFWQGMGESWLPVYPLSEYVTDVSSAEISISSALFREKYDDYGDYYPFKIKCTAWRPGGTPGVTSITVKVNAPPKPGVCDVTPRTGTQAVDQMRITCRGWSDVEGIYRATVVATFDQGVPGLTPNPNKVTIAQPMLTSWTGLIPNGISTSRGITTSSVNLVVTVEDVVGGITYYDVGNVTISVPSAAEVKQLEQEQAQAMADYNKLIQEGNIEAARDLAIHMAVVNDAIHNSITSETYECSADNQSCLAAKQKQKEDISDLALTVESLVLGQLTREIEDVQSAIALLSGLSQLLEHSDVITQDTQAKALDKMKEVWLYLSAQKGAVSEEEMQALAVASMYSLDSLAKTTQENQNDPILEDKKRSCESNFYKFDNSIDAETGDLGDFNAEDQKRLLCDQAHGEKGKYQANSYIDTVLEATNKIAEMVLAVQTPGGRDYRMETPHSVLTAAAGGADNIGGREYSIGENSSLIFPPIDSCMNISDNTTMFGMTTYNSKTDCLPTVTNANVGCGCLHILFYVDKSKKDISNCSEPIVMSQPKCPPKVIPQTDRNLEDNRTGRGEMDSEGWQSFNVTRMPRLTLRLDLPTDQQWAVGLFEVDPTDTDVVLMVLSKCNGRARWNYDSGTWEYDYVTYLPNDNQTRRYSWMVPDCYVPGGNVHIYSEVFQLNHTVFETYKDSGRPCPNDTTSLFTTSLRLKNELAGCYYFDEASVTWMPTKVSDRMMQDPDSIVCESDHLTTFSSGMAVAPNAIDWAFVFANLDFFKNPTLYVTEILILVCYIAAVIWARRKDNKDIEKLGLTPLLDNKPEDKYLYEIFIATGHRRNAGTDSKVFLILSGDYDDTEPRMVVGPGKRKLLRRGSTDGLLLATNRPLGNLNYVRVWHDNSGKGNFTSWYLKHVMVQDLQTKNKYFFISNQWFAVEEGDGMVDRVVPVAGQEQMVEFAHLFSHTTQKNLGDDHLWYSVVARPPESRFTRVQRVSCCLLLLYTNMLANGLWYDRAKEGKGAALTLGPFSLSMEQLYVGMMTNLIIFPINFLVVQLFRKSPPRKKRKSRVKEALEAQHLGSDLIEEDGGKTARVHSAISPTPRSATGIELQTKADDQEDHSSHLQANHLQPDYSQDPQYNHPQPDHSPHPQENKKTKKKFQVPWWFRVLAWLVLWAAVLTSAVIVTALGVTFGDAKAKKWITALIVSFATSIFLTQPLQVLLFAMLFSILFKKPGLDREEAEEDEEKPPLQDNEEWVLPEEGYYLDARPRQVGYKPPDPKVLEYAREQRLKELKMYDILREIIFYCVFLWLLLVISYTFRPSIGFVLKDQVRSNFIDQGLGYNLSFMEDLEKVASHRQFWDWLNVTFLPGLVAGQWYNGDWIPVSRGFLADRANRIMGYATMRQLRVKRGTCDIVPDFRHLISECNEGYSIWSEDVDSYGTGWAQLSHNVSAVEEFTYKTGSDIDSYPFWAKHALYDGGGYVAALRGGLDKLAALAERLRKERWIDKSTRAVFLEFTTYNPGVNLFSIVTIVAEFLPSGGISPMYRVEPVSLLAHYGPLAIFEMITQAVFGAFILFFCFKECRNISRQGRQYFADAWNWVEMLIVVLSISGTGICIYRYVLVNRLAATFKETHGNGYVKFQYVGYWQELLLYMVGLLVFLANLKFLKLLRFNQRMSMLGATLRVGAKSLFMFSIMFSIVFFAFVQFFFFTYFKYLNNFKTPVHAVETCVQMMLGRFNFDAMYATSPVMGASFFFVYIISCAYILVNMFVSILNDSFTRVRMDLSLQSNEHEMVDFILHRFKTLAGMKTESGPGQAGEAGNGEECTSQGGEDGDNLPLSVEASIEHFPHKVDRLLNCISKIMFFEHLHEKVYFDRNKFDDIFETHGAVGGAAGKAALRQMENKDEMRRVMARMMLTSFADPTNVQQVQKDYDMI